ncbi:MAG: SulP family inorganic anion transporter [Bacteroidota bacterium]
MFKHIRGDLFGGITAGIVALPLALAFGVSSGLGPSAGLYGAIFISFFAALFGGTNTQISGPTAPMTAVSMVVIASILALYDGNVAKALPTILAVFLMAGVIQILLGIVGLGKYIKYIPYPVVSGFMTAIGIIILITQILPAVGYYPKEDKEFVAQYAQQAQGEILKSLLSKEVGEGIPDIQDFEKTLALAENITQEDLEKEAKTLAGKASSGVLGTLKVLPRAVSNINWLELALALATIIIIYGFKKITTVVPSTLVALILVSGLAYGFGLNYRPIEEIPAGLPLPNFEIFTAFSLSSVTPYIFTALTLALLGAIDSLLTSVVADNMTQTKHKPNKELIGQGIGNSIGALFGGIPGAGATIRTVVNINSGGKTRLSGMISGILLLFVLLALGPVASQIPAAVLAGILITVGIGVMDYKGLKAIPHLPKDIQLGPLKLSSEVIIMLTVMVLSSLWNLVYAVGIGLILASLMFMKKMGDITAKKSGVISLAEEDLWEDEKEFLKKYAEEVYIKHIIGPLFFGSTTEFQQLAEHIPPTAKTVIFRMEKMPYLDQTGLYALEGSLKDFLSKDMKVLLVKVLEQPRYMMERIDVIPDLIPPEAIFPNFETCVGWVEANVKDEYSK